MTFEDFERLKATAQNFNDLSDFIATSGAGDALQTDPELVELERKIRPLLLQGAALGEGAQEPRIAKQRAQLIDLYSQRSARIRELAELPGVDQWIIDALTQWIETFMAGRLTARLVPFPEVPTFELLANLKPDCFFDSDFGHWRITYGPRPNVDLTILGLIASTPDPTTANEEEESDAAPAAGGLSNEEALPLRFAPCSRASRSSNDSLVSSSTPASPSIRLPSIGRCACRRRLHR